eukprot:508410_1
MIIIYLLNSVLTIIIWFGCNIFSNKLLVYYNNVNSMNSCRLLHISDPQQAPNLHNNLCCKAYTKFKIFWKKYKFLNQNLMVITTSIIAIIGAAWHLEESKHSQTKFDDLYLAQTQLVVIGAICGFIIIVAISSMILHKYQCNWCLVILSYDNKFRFLCIVKTTLILIKQILIYIQS